MSPKHSTTVLLVLAALAALVSHQVAEASPAPFNLGHFIKNVGHTANAVLHKGTDIASCVSKANVPVSVALKAASCASNKNPYMFAGCTGLKNIGSATQIVNCITHGR